MHFQKAPHAEAKFLRCVRGAVFDVMIDLRPDSPTFKKWFGIELTADNHKMVFIPEGFAHGYLTTVDDTEVFYLVSAFYSPDAEGGVRWDDPAFGVKWPMTGNLIISEKDRSLPDFSRLNHSSDLSIWEMGKAPEPKDKHGDHFRIKTRRRRPGMTQTIGDHRCNACRN